MLKTFRPTVLSIALPVSLTGCAVVPDATLTYRAIEWTAVVTVIQTMACSKASGQEPIIESAVSVAPHYSAGSKTYSVRIKDLDAFYADMTLAVGFTEDGRLKSINASTTGQGEAFTKNLVSALASAHGAHAVAAVGNKNLGVPVCDVLAKYSPEGKPVTVKHSARIDAKSHNKLLSFTTADESQYLHEKLKGAVGYPELTLQVGNPIRDDNRISFGAAAFREDVGIGVVKLPIQYVDSLLLITKSSTPQAEKSLHKQSILVPSENTFDLAIPKPAFFGKQDFGLSLADSGRITAINYGKGTGAAGLLGAAQAGISFEQQRMAAEANALKVEADLIAQQQRLIACKLNESNCK